MRDRLAARHLALGALDIDMDPLMVAGRVGEFVDLLLGDRVPVADPDLLALIGLQIGGAFDFQHRLSPLVLSLCCGRLLRFARNDIKKRSCHCEERSDEEIPRRKLAKAASTSSSVAASPASPSSIAASSSGVAV